MKNLSILFAGSALFLAVACSSKKPGVETNAPANVKLPAWAFTPSVEDGIASAQCVKFSGELSLDQQEVTAKGRAALAQQISVRAQVMDKTFQDKTTAEGKTVTGSTFQSVSKQIADQNLVGSKLVKTEFGTVNDVSYLCGMVAITNAETKKMFDAIVKDKTAPSVSAKDEAILYQEFKGYKAQQDLDQAVGNTTKPAN